MRYRIAMIMFHIAGWLLWKGRLLSIDAYNDEVVWWRLA